MKYSANVISIAPLGCDFAVQLEPNQFYPGGGGQPPDHGILESASFSGQVLGAEKQGSDTVLVVRVTKGRIKAGDAVVATIDWQRRTKLTKSHTAEHILFKSIQKFVSDVSLDKIRLEEEESVIHVRCKTLTWDVLLNAEQLANNVVKQDLAVKEEYADKNSLEASPELRIKKERIASDAVRIISIEGFDRSACSGTHVTHTAEIGNIIITGLNESGAAHEVRFKVDTMQPLYSFAGIGRQILSLLGTQQDTAVKALHNILEERDKLKRELLALSKSAHSDVQEESINSMRFVTKTFEDADKKRLTLMVQGLMKEKTVVLFINKASGGIQYNIYVSADLPHKAGDIGKAVNAALNGKGGGSKDYASGTVDCDANRLVDFVRNFLSNV
ncbi:hypothetical protein HY642_01550 [Candidatus Woesearchaeota archaeon]|nr:hypothetical protein [Candidatus Woesearchaeota archaeon]